MCGSGREPILRLSLISLPGVVAPALLWTPSGVIAAKPLTVEFDLASRFY